MIDIVLIALTVVLLFVIVPKRKESFEDEIKRNFTRNYWNIKD